MKETRIKKSISTLIVLLSVMCIPLTNERCNSQERISKADPVTSPASEPPRKPQFNRNLIATPERSCPITCSADSKGWKVVFECEQKGQSVRKTYYKGYSTTFVNGKPQYIKGDVGFKFESSGNFYRVTVDIEPCSESDTGYCIKVVARGDNLGDKPVTCQNF